MSDRNDFADKEAVDEKGVAVHEEGLLAPLSDEEKRIEKKLLFKIDALIMPLVPNNATGRLLTC
jgi:hypothetical protein